MSQFFYAKIKIKILNKSKNKKDICPSTLKVQADIFGYTPSEVETLKYPQREFHVAVPVQMDDGTTKVFQILRRTAASWICSINTARIPG